MKRPINRCPRCEFAIPLGTRHEHAHDCLELTLFRFRALGDKSRRQALSAASADARIDRYREQAKVANKLLGSEQRKVKRAEERILTMGRTIQEQGREITELRRQLARIGGIVGRAAA